MPAYVIRIFNKMLSIIIPTLNEKKNINQIANNLSKIKIVSEVIFVDDNSIDGTFQQIKKLKKKNFFKGFNRNKEERDLSKSVLYGVSKSSQNVILVMDCDLQHDTQYIELMWKKFLKNKCDILVASRFKKKNVLGNLGFLRSLTSNLAIFIINLIFGKKTSDPLSGFFICKKRIITKNKKFFFARGYKILFDILYNIRDEVKVVDYSIVFKKRIFEKSKFKLKIIILFLKHIFYTKFNFKIN